MGIRKAKKEDLDDIKRMDDISLKAVHSFGYFKRNLNNTIVAVKEKRIVGYFMFRNEIAMNLVIHPDYRKTGVGKMLVKEAMKKEKRLVSRTREENINAIEFLRHLGFKYKRKIENYYKNGDNAIEMEWKKT